MYILKLWLNVINKSAPFEVPTICMLRSNPSQHRVLTGYKVVPDSDRSFGASEQGMMRHMYL